MKPAGFYTDDSSDEFDDCYFSNVSEEIPVKRELTVEEKREEIRQEVYRLSSINHTAPIIDFLNDGFDVNTILPDDWTLLLFAATFGNYQFVKELIDRGANVKLHRNLVTPLMAACSSSKQNNPLEESLETVKLLLDKGANANGQDRSRVTPLMYAASYGNLAVVKLLLEISNKNDLDNQGWDALFWAVCTNQVETCQLLLNDGFNPKRVDVRGFTCLHYAKQHDFHDVVKILPDTEDWFNNSINENTSYVFGEELEEQTFLRDVILILKACNCQKLIETFVEAKVNLKRFLALTREDLAALGVVKPYQQDRILGGLFQFHQKPYLSKSVGFVRRNEVHTTVNVGVSIISTLRHLIVMESAVKYLRLNLKNLKPKALIKDIDGISEKLKGVEKTVQALSKRITVWEKENAHVDLISPAKDKTRGWFLFSLVVTVPLIYSIKNIYS